MKAMLNLLPALALLIALAASGSERDEFRQGIEAFRGGHYSEALHHFQQAEAMGLRSVSLDYNLGATHYRLGSYSESARHFQRIRGDRDWGALAEYNLGLIAEQQRAPDRAREHYREAVRKARADRIQQLAAARLQALEPAPAAAVIVDPGWVVYLSAAAVFDDNPALARGDDFAPGKDSDYLLETLGTVSGYLRGDANDGVRLNAGFYSRNHNDFTEFDITGISAAIFLDDQGSTWRFERGLRVANYWLDGDRYTTEAALALRGTRALGTMNLSIRNDLSYIDASSDFEFVKGIRNQLILELFGSAAFGRWRVGYGNEFNDRDDLDSEVEFLSYSPWRHEVYGQLSQRLTDRMGVQTRLAFRHSHYRDDNREVGLDNVLTEKQRKEDRFMASILLRYALTRTFSTFAEYRYTNNDSNFDRFSYRGNQIQVGIDATF